MPHPTNPEEVKRKLGGRIHKILNETVWRKLTFTEYEKLVHLIAKIIKTK